MKADADLGRHRLWSSSGLLLWLFVVIAFYYPEDKLLAGSDVRALGQPGRRVVRVRSLEKISFGMAALVAFLVYGRASVETGPKPSRRALCGVSLRSLCAPRIVHTVK